MDRRTIIIGIVSLAVLFGLGFVFYSQYKKITAVRGTSLAPLLEKPLYQEAEELHHAGESGAIERFEKVLEEEKDPNRRALIQAKIAADQYRTGDLEGKKKAVERVKAIIADPKISDGARAGYITLLLEMGTTVRDLSFMENVFFAGEPYQTIFNKSRREISLSMRRLYEWSLDLFPTSYAHLQLAHWYGLRLLRQDYSISPPGSRTADIKSLKDNLAKGEALIERDRIYNSRSRQATLHDLHAINHGILALFKEGDMARAEELFKSAISFAEAVPDDVHSRNVGFDARTQYAVMLLDFYGAPRRDDVCALMEPIAELKPEDAPKFTYIQWAISLIESIGQPHPVGYAEPYPTHSDLVKIAQICPGVRKAVEGFAGSSLEELLRR